MNNWQKVRLFMETRSVLYFTIPLAVIVWGLTGATIITGNVVYPILIVITAVITLAMLHLIAKHTDRWWEESKEL